MSDQEINGAIAEACGWKDFDCNDLNAMHEAEKTLLTQCGNDPQDDLWIDYLANLLHAAPLCLREHATARQRAEAFLKTIGKWEDVAK